MLSSVLREAEKREAQEAEKEAKKQAVEDKKLAEKQAHEAKIEAKKRAQEIKKQVQKQARQPQSSEQTRQHRRAQPTTGQWFPEFADPQKPRIEFKLNYMAVILLGTAALGFWYAFFLLISGDIFKGFIILAVCLMLFAINSINNKLTKAN